MILIRTLECKLWRPFWILKSWFFAKKQINLRKKKRISSYVFDYILVSFNSSLLNRVPCVPAWSTCPSANVLTCEGRANYSTWCANFATWPAKRLTNFSTIFQNNFCFWIFQFCLTFANLNIWSIVEHLSRETKNLNFDIWKISLRKNLINLTLVSIERVGLTEQLFG